MALLLIALPSTMLASATVESVLGNLQANIEPIKQFLVGLSYIIGISLAFHAIMKLKKFGFKTAMMHVEVSVVSCFAQFFAGIGLIYLPSLVESINQTLFMQPDVGSVMSYTSGRGQSFDTYLRPVLGIVQVIGLISFIRGWVQLAKVGQQGTQPGTISKAITHIVGGIMAINIVFVIQIVQATLLG